MSSIAIAPPRSVTAALEQWGKEVEYGHLESIKGLLVALDFVITEEENIRLWARSNCPTFKSSEGRVITNEGGLCDLMVAVAIQSHEEDGRHYATREYNITLYYLTATFTSEKYGQENWYPVTLPEQDGAELFDETTPEQKWSFGDYAEARWKYAREFREWLANFVEEYAAKVEAEEQTNAKSL